MGIKEQTVMELIEALRERRWLDSAIAEELGTNEINIYRWRKGLKKPRMDMLVKRALRELLERP